MFIIESVNSNLWAKKQEKFGQYFWLPLSQHLDDTRYIAERLWELWLSEGQRQLIIYSLSEPVEDIAKKLISFLGAIHDLGKATPAFQAKESFPRKKDLDLQLLERLEKGGFIGITQAILPSSRMSPHALAGQTILSWHGVGDDIGSIVGGHHGKPIDQKKQYIKQYAFSENYFQEDSPEKSIYQKWKRIQTDVINWALKISGFNSVEELPKISQKGQIILSGLLIMADWIASNEDYFPLIGIEEMKIKYPEIRYTSGWKKWIKSYQWEPEYYSVPQELYEKRFGFKEPHNIQKTFTDIIEQSAGSEIFILEAPMGIGKTEAALIGVEQLAKKTGRNGLFFGLPTQATSNGIYPRIYSWLNKISKEFDENLPIRLAHGKAALNDDFSSLARNINIDEERKDSIFVNEWFSGRKTTALDDFVVGTVDQFLLLALKQKHLALRHLGFSKKVIIIDEVHSYDAYMSQYLERALEWMGAYEVPIIILSATLAADSRKRLIESYIKGKGFKKTEVEVQAGAYQTDAYPIITYTDGKQVKQVSHTGTLKENEVTVQVEKIDEEAVHSLIDILSKQDGIIGIIVNTVKRSQDLAKYCIEKYDEETVELLHSNFIATDRTKKEENLLKMIGKNAKRPKHKIIIGTQVIEQSLDIDFDVLISDLAPMDLLLQRVGRLHRHKIDRPKNHKTPKLYVIGTDDQLAFEEGSKYIYGGYLLARTQYFLKDSINLPTQISTLVQNVYGNKEIVFEPEVQKEYLEMKKKNKEAIQQKKRKANTFRIARPAGASIRRNTIIGWLDSSVINQSEERAYAQVRDINETIEVIALKKVEDGYGLFNEEVNLSHEIDDFNISKEIAKHTLRLPFALSYPKVIDETIDLLEKENERTLKDWQNQSWLRGSLGIIFDENNQYRLNGYLLTYDTKYGLTYDKEEKNGKV